jgi:hypothetical protein
MKPAILILMLFLLAGLRASAQPGARPPVPPIAPPAGSLPAVRDTCANFWTLAPAEKGARRLLVLPAQEPVRWVDPQIRGAEPAAWTAIRADEIGFVWLARGVGAGRRYTRFDPRKPQNGAGEAELARTSADAQRQWRVAAFMPASNHDLTAAVLGNKFYVSGGLTAEWGFPTRSHAFDELWELDTRTWRWRAAAKLGRERIYCATAAFDNKVWVIGGDVLESNGTRHAVTITQVYDPRTGEVTDGPLNTIARPMPLALVADGRLYALGNIKGQYELPGKMESIGPGETSWRPEPDAPSGPGAMGPLAGAALDGKLYVAVPGRGLAVFDTAAGRWQLLESPAKPRSCQMAAYRGEIWMLGGRDTEGEEQTLIYSPRTGSWRKGPPLPRPLSWGAAGVVNGQLIVTGGAASYGKDYLYNDRTFVFRGGNSQN